VLAARRVDAVGPVPPCLPPAPNPTRTPRTVKQAIADLSPPPADGSEHPDWPKHRADRLSSVDLARIRALGKRQERDSLPAHLLAPCHPFPAKRNLRRWFPGTTRTQCGGSAGRRGEEELVERKQEETEQVGVGGDVGGGVRRG